jgi:sulfate transport system substrate-binding protein
VTTSVVVLVVRPGNPLGITGWDDLVRPGVEIVTPNPGSSGAARWNILAAAAHILTGNADADRDIGVRADGVIRDDLVQPQMPEGRLGRYLRAFFANTVAMPGNSREATTSFLAGTGDVLVSYENEAIQARQHGAALDYVVPSDTLLVENPGAVLIDADPVAREWLKFVLSDQAQTVYAANGFRPLNGTDPGVVDGANDPEHPYPVPERLATIDGTFGGWPDANRLFFDEHDGIVTVLQREARRDG